MVLETLKKKIKVQPKVTEPEDEFVELPEPGSEEQRVPVRIEQLQSFADTEKVLQYLRDGNVIFLRIKDLRGKDITELKRAVERLKKTVQASNGDIVGIDEDFIILTPNFARVYR